MTGKAKKPFSGGFPARKKARKRPNVAPAKPVKYPLDGKTCYCPPDCVNRGTEVCRQCDTVSEYRTE